MRIAFVSCASAALFVVAACSSGEPAEDPAFDAPRTLAEIVASLEVGLDADLYRFDPPTDVTGENLYRSSRARLERYEELLPDPAFVPAIRFAKALAAERTFDFAAAADEYAAVAGGGSDLAPRAAELLPFAREMSATMAPPSSGAIDEALMHWARARADLNARLDSLDTSAPRESLVLASIEQLDVLERELLWRARLLSPSGARVAIDAARQVVADHQESRRIYEHSLRLADMYAEVAREYAVTSGPESYEHDAAYLRNLVTTAMQIYAEVAAVDGRPEREEARAQLVALEALLDRVGPAPFPVPEAAR